jgi:hypothetical protein
VRRRVRRARTRRVRVHGHDGARVVLRQSPGRRRRRRRAGGVRESPRRRRLEKFALGRGVAAGGVAAGARLPALHARRRGAGRRRADGDAEGGRRRGDGFSARRKTRGRRCAIRGVGEGCRGRDLARAAHPRRARRRAGRHGNAKTGGDRAGCRDGALGRAPAVAAGRAAGTRGGASRALSARAAGFRSFGGEEAPRGQEERHGSRFV